MYWWFTNFGNDGMREVLKPQAYGAAHGISNDVQGKDRCYVCNEKWKNWICWRNADEKSWESSRFPEGMIFRHHPSKFIWVKAQVSLQDARVEAKRFERKRIMMQIRAVKQCEIIRFDHYIQPRSITRLQYDSSMINKRIKQRNILRLIFWGL